MVRHTKKSTDNSGDNIKKLLKDQTDKLIEIFDDRISIVTEQYNDIHKTLESHSEQIGNILMDLTEVKRDTKEVKFHVNLQMDNKLDKKHFVDLDQRVRKLEKK